MKITSDGNIPSSGNVTQKIIHVALVVSLQSRCLSSTPLQHVTYSLVAPKCPKHPLLSCCILKSPVLGPARWRSR